LLKYQVLEQYEDALNNLELPRARVGELALRQFGDEYLLRYLLEFETAGSPSLLNVERLAHPFDYRLKVQEGDELVERTVDLIETFNYLLGLHVKKLWEFGGSADCQSAVSRTASPRKRQLPNGATPTAAARLYRAVLGEDRRGKSVVVVWRDTAGLEDNPAALQQDRQFIEQTILPALLGKDAWPDRLWVNQPCTVAEAEAIEPEFKRLMFAPIE
jgi:adenine-specific DNA-methyltransferase